jgi:hypothetical protein
MNGILWLDFPKMEGCQDREASIRRQLFEQILPKRASELCCEPNSYRLNKNMGAGD